jgi:hypothetical protein
MVTFKGEEEVKNTYESILKLNKLKSIREAEGHIEGKLEDEAKVSKLNDTVMHELKMLKT